jgi:tetratricopeptide (TPR) repeat protein
VEAGLSKLRAALAATGADELRNALGVLLTEHGAGTEAVAVLAPLARAPDAGATAWLNYGNALVAAGRTTDALPFLQHAADAEPSAADVWYSLGRAQQLAGDVVSADASYARTTALDMSHTLAWANRSTTAFFLGRRSDALRHAERAVALDPQYDGAQFNRAVALLAARRWREAWAAYEWRWHTPMLAPQRRRWTSPTWNGAPLMGTLLVFAEQGFGDTIQGVRWLRAARARATRVVLWCAEPLTRWLHHCGVADDVVAFGAPTPAHDAHVALWSLPQVLGLCTDDAVMGDGAPYLRAGSVADDASREHAAAHEDLRVGLAWAGSPTHINDRHRSVSPESLLPLLRTPGVTWVNVQYDQPGALEALLRRAGGTGTVAHTPPLRDFADTAQVLSSCDLVIAVDSAVAHAAGALGIATWLLLPRIGLDWRWSDAGETSDHVPWYGSVRTWRVPAGGSWHDVIVPLAAHLQRTAATHHAARGAAHARALRWPDAQRALQQAAAADADNPAIQVNLATSSLAVRHFAAARDAAHRATALAPTLPDAWCRLADVESVVGNDAAAVRAAEHARALAPRDRVVLGTLARALERADALDASLQVWDTVLATATGDDPLAQYNRSLVLLKQGRWAQGWLAYEWRWATPTYLGWRTAWPPLPWWDGEVRPGLHVLVRHEQGLGDTVMAARWWPTLVARGLRVTAQVPEPLVSLLRGQFPHVTVEPIGAPTSAEVIVPALSVPSRLGIGAPTGDAYLTADRGRVAAVRAQLAHAPRPWRGLVWAGEPTHPFDHLRSRPLAQFHNLRVAQPGTWISLQVGTRRSELAQAPDMVDAGAQVRDFADTAAWLSVLDELVAVDTSVAHLAGALGVPTLLLLPACADWRWGVSGERTGWYDRMRLFRAKRPALHASI